MKSFAFPNFLKNSSTTLLSDKEATYSNLRLLLLSRKKEFFGDPYFGTSLYEYIYEQGDIALTNIIKDAIYTDIAEFMPQLRVKRNDIEITLEKNKINLGINAINVLDGTSDLYNISLINNGEA